LHEEIHVAIVQVGGMPSGFDIGRLYLLYLII